MKLLQKQHEKINGIPITYHGRMTGGLEVITPHKCKHDKAYVYASNNIPLCIIFAVKRTGENITFGVGKFGKPYITEFYQGAFDDRFKNRVCYLYKLPKKEFSCKTEYIELVCDKPVKVMDCIKIYDSASYLLSLEKQGKLKINRYQNLNKKQKKHIQEILINALKKYIDFKLLSNQEYFKLNDEEKLNYNIKKQRYEFCIKKFPAIMEKLKMEKLKMTTTEELILKIASAEDKEKVWSFRQEFIDTNDKLAGDSSLLDFDTYEDWLQRLDLYSSEKTVPADKVPVTQFLTIRKSDNKLVGMINIRHRLNDVLLIRGGHIGDCIRPSERNKGYATEQLRLALEHCKTMGIDKVLITCKKTNIASAKTIIKNGGVLENEIEHDGVISQRYWITLND